MKKILGFGLLGAAMLLGAQSAQAVPTIKLSMTQSAAAGCGTMANGGLSPGLAAGTFTAGGTCTWSTTGGVINLVGTYGTWAVNQELAVGNPFMPAPALWLNSTNVSSVASTLVIKLVGMNYATPLSLFPLLTTTSATLHTGTSYSIQGFFDSTNSGVAGAGMLVMNNAAAAAGSYESDVINTVNNDDDGLYSVSWILTITRTSTGALRTVGMNAEMAHGVPAPAAMALLGFGLIAVGAFRRRAA